MGSQDPSPPKPALKKNKQGKVVVTEDTNAKAQLLRMGENNVETALDNAEKAQPQREEEAHHPFPTNIIDERT